MSAAEKNAPAAPPKPYRLLNDDGWLKAVWDEKSACERCDGGGVILSRDKDGRSYARPCVCAEQRRRLDLLNAAGIPGKYAAASFDTFEADRHPSLKRARDLALDFAKNFGSGNRGLVFMGAPGAGKTHLAAAILKTLTLDRGVPCKFVEFFQLLTQIRHGYSEDRSEMDLILPFVKAKVLLIDELGKGRHNNEWELTVLDQIISSRYNAGDKVTLFTTNYLVKTPDKEKSAKKRGGSAADNVTDTRDAKYGQSLTQEYLEDRIGVRIFSRLAEMCRFVEMAAVDYRHFKSVIHRAAL